jgi:hypothetical protein
MIARPPDRLARLRIAVRYLVTRDQLARGHQSRLAEHFGITRQRVSQIVGDELARHESASRTVRQLAARDGGQMLIVFALAIVPIFWVMLVLTVDVGLWYGAHADARTAADAAALAGAVAYVLDPAASPADAEAEAREYAQRNGASTDPPSTFVALPDCETAGGTVLAGVPSVVVTIRAQAPALFVSAFGIDPPEVGAIAAACAGVIAGDALTPPTLGGAVVVRLVK